MPAPAGSPPVHWNGRCAQGTPRAGGYPERRLDELLAAVAAAQPDRPAIVTAAATTTFGRFADRVERAAGVLRGWAGPGAPVAVASVLDPEFAVAYYGALRGGHAVVPVNPLLPAAALAHVLSRSGARIAVLTWALAQRLGSGPGTQHGEALRERLPLLDAVLLLDRPPAGSDPDSDVAAGAAEPPALVLADLLATAAPIGADRAAGAGQDDLACVQFTSGTTGLPKGVRLTHRNLTRNACQIAEAHRLDRTSVTANHLPTYHPMHLNSALVAGATQVLCAGDDAADAIELAGRNAATHYYSLPPRLARLATDPRLPRLRLPSLRVVLSGGSALPTDAADVLAGHFSVPVVQGYGLAETSPLTHSDLAANPKRGSVGPPVPDTECRIVGVEDRTVLAAGQAGEVQVRGPQLMSGYLGAEPDAGIDPDGWFSTGDVGRLDGDGWLFLVDRIKDVFKCDNWLVSPTAIERVLGARAEIGECCVVDMPDERTGAAAYALIVAADPASTRGQIEAAVAATNEQLPYYEHIRAFEVVQQIPRSGNGKVLRAEIRARLRDGETAFIRHEGVSVMVLLVNKFTLAGTPEEFERIWESSSEFMRRQPGFVSFRLVRSISEPNVYINIAQWRDAESHQRVVASPEFRGHIAELAQVAKAEPTVCQVVLEHGAA